MVRENDSRNCYRCVVPVEVSAATLKINGRRYPCRVTDASRESFGICISTKCSRKLVVGKPKLELLFSNERWSVLVDSHFQESDELLHVGLARVRELTKVKSPVSVAGGLSSAHVSLTGDPSFLLALMVAFLLTCICLPGIGDSLGTAPRVREGVNNMVEYVTQAVN